MSKLLKNKLVVAALLSSCALSANAVGSVEDSVARGLRGAMKAIQLPTEVARERAEDVYTYNVQSGTDMTEYDLLTGDSGNDYLQTLKICANYSIFAKFDAESDHTMTGGGAITPSTTVPLPRDIQNGEIYLVPVYASGDYKITTWECLTNISLDGTFFQGDSRDGIEVNTTVDMTTAAVRATLAKYTDDPVMEKCMYAKNSTAADSVWKAVTDACSTAVTHPA